MTGTSHIQGKQASCISAGLLVFLMLISIAAAQGPTAPHAFFGTAEINGRAVPAGSVLTAEVGGIVRGSVTFSQEGTWGQGVPDEPLVVQNAQNGQEISFYIQTPQMTNRITATETATFESGAVDSITLTFNGEEKLKTSGGSGNGGSSGGGGSGGSGGGTVPEEPGEPEVVEQPQEGAVYGLELNGTETLAKEMGNKDTANIILDGEEYPILLKSMSDFSVLFEYDGKTIVLGEGESKEIDLNGDYVTDITVTLEKIEDGKAFLTFAGLEKSAAEASVEGITGFALANPAISGVITIILIGVIGGVALKLRRRGSK
jgi:hypothetical protein